MMMQRTLWFRRHDARAEYASPNSMQCNLYQDEAPSAIEAYVVVKLGSA